MLIIKNAKILCPDKVIEKGVVRIEGNTITNVVPAEQCDGTCGCMAENPTVIDAQGMLLMPGLTNCHMHLYSTFARGMAPKGDPAKNFVEILERLWWRLDKALTEEDVYYSALIPLVECLKAGTTSFIDHHASPNFVTGSLNTIKKALTQIPVRASLCYEVSDRDGKKSCQAGIQENAHFIQENKSNMLNGLFGLHASFTVSDKTVEQCARIVKELNTGIHVHTAEDRADPLDSRRKYKMGVVDRWNKFGLLGPKSILVHGVHVSADEMNLIAETKTNLVHNPESNMNNAVGCADVIKMLHKGCLVGLGTDGMTSDMFQEAKFAHLIRKHVTGDSRVGFMEAGQLLFENNYKILANIFEGNLGRIETGALADVILLDYNSPTPLTRDNFWGHFLYGMNSSLVDTTIVNGKVLMRDRKLVEIDEEEICAKSRELAKKLWDRL